VRIVQPIQRFSFDRTTPPVDLGNARLCLDGQPTKLRLDATGIEGQYACRHGFLLLVTNGLLWWDDFQLVLLSDDLRVLDHVWIEYQLDRAEMGEHRPVGPDELEFVFRERWRVRVLPSPRRFPQLAWHVYRESARFTTPRYLWFNRVGRAESA
jgi:hypothetical protein